MPVTAITGKTRRLDREHSADTAVADRCEQPLEAGTRDAATGAAEVVVDDIDVAPAKLLGAIDEAVLAPSALMIMSGNYGDALHRLTDNAERGERFLRIIRTSDREAAKTAVKSKVFQFHQIARFCLMIDFGATIYAETRAR